MLKAGLGCIKVGLTVGIVIMVLLIFQVLKKRDELDLKISRTLALECSQASSTKRPWPVSDPVPKFSRQNDTYFRYETCANLVRPDPGAVEYRNHWQVYRQEKKEIMTYSAFYDDRPDVGLMPVVRLIAVSALDGQRDDVFCYIWYDDLQHPYVTNATSHENGAGDNVDNRRYGQMLYTCQLPGSYPTPTHVSLALSLCQPSSMLLPVVYPVRRDWEHQFGVCVAISFGKMPINELIEWIEFHVLVGVSEFNVYDGNVSEEMHDVYKHYEDKGLLKVYKMPPPVDKMTYGTVQLSNPASLNDCMLRNMYRYRYIVVIDFDEYIVPKSDIDLKGVLELVDKKEKLQEPFHSYTFRNTYFMREYGQYKEEPEFAHTLRYRNRTAPNGFLYASKSIVDPRKCLSVFNHYCWIRFPKDVSKLSIDVDAEIAASHHYRKCNHNCEMYKKNETLDNSMLLFKDRLVKRMEPALEQLKYKPSATA